MVKVSVPSCNPSSMSGNLKTVEALRPPAGMVRTMFCTGAKSVPFTAVSPRSPPTATTTRVSVVKASAGSVWPPAPITSSKAAVTTNDTVPSASLTDSGRALKVTEGRVS